MHLLNDIRVVTNKICSFNVVSTASHGTKSINETLFEFTLPYMTSSNTEPVYEYLSLRKFCIKGVPVIYPYKNREDDFRCFGFRS